MDKRVVACLKVGLALALGLLLTGCALRSLFGNVIYVQNIGEEVNEIIETVFSDSTAAVCLGTDYGYYECTYIIDGDILTSTFYLLSEYGLAGVLIDPVVVQVPANSVPISATYNLGDNTGEHPLVVTQRANFQVTPDISVTAELSRTFFILELPSSVDDDLPGGDPAAGLPISYTLQFMHTQPISEPVGTQSIKLMLTGKVIINGHGYYVPLVPCVTDFASIPALVIPQSGQPVNLEAALGDLFTGANNEVCDHEGYYYNNVPPPAFQVRLPLIGK